jgi:hypothetical protein
MIFKPLTLDWRSRSECFPFEDEDNYYITVESEYETPGDAKESRLIQAQRDGVFKLLKFYGKDTTGVLEEQGGIFDLSSVEDYYVAYRPCVKMKVLVSIPKTDFDSVEDDPTACEINKPEEGYLSAFIPIRNGSVMISEVVEGMISLTFTLLNADNYISNVNILREAQRLAAAGRAIQRYIDLNNMSPVNIEDPECVQPTEVDLQLEIGFSYDYKAVFALVEGDQHTIGYDCFLETSVLNHNTTVNYLLNLKEMLSDLQLKNEPSFNAFDFFTKYTIPTPIILPKENNLDGLEKYDENGNLFSFANLAKLITLDLDVNLCKTDEEKAQEDSLLYDPAAKANIAKTAKQTKEFIGDNKLSTEGVKQLRESIEDARERSEQEGGALNVLYEDVMAKVNLGCVLEETIQCLLENMITTYGQEVFDDPDLAQVINVRNVSLGGLNNNCSFDRCDGTRDENYQLNFPVFQGINIPNDLPTLDFLAETIDNALVSLYNTLVSSLSSLILGILQGLCDLILSFPDGIAQIGDGFKSWLSQTLGVDLSSLDDPEVWKSVLLSETGGGFLGVIGNAAINSVGGSLERAYSQTGISLNLPNPETGEVENFFVSPEFVATFFSELNDGVDDMETVLTPSETQSIFRGNARQEVLDLAFKCVTRNGSTIFTSPESFQDIMSGIGDILKPQFLTQNIVEEPPVASDYCDLTDNLEIRQEILKGKDSTLSSEEIDEIINKEKERKKATLLQKVDELNSYQAGGLAPAFPNIFGKGGLIPETPPVISEIQSIVIQGSLNSAVYNFNSEASSYSEIYQQYFEDIGSNVKYPLNVNQVIIDSTNGVNFLYDGTGFGGDYILGYSIPEELISEELQEVSSTIELGPYVFGGDIDITGIDGKGGLHGQDGPKNRNRNGESADDEKFEQLVSELEPYVANSTHTFDTYFFENFIDGIGESQAESISGARAYAYLLMLEADRLQLKDVGDNEKFSTINPFWESTFRDQDPQLFQLKVVLDNRDEKKNTNEVTIKIKVFSEPVVVEKRNTANITKIDVSPYARVETTPVYAEQNIEDYTIGNTSTLLGRKIATGFILDETYNYSPVVSTIDISDIDIVLNPQSSKDIFDTIVQGTDAPFESTRHEVIQKYLKDFFSYINLSKYYQGNVPEAFADIVLTYPANDVLQYNELQQFGTELLPVVNEKVFSNQYCDTLDPARRVNSIMCARMLVRLYVMELALISIQVFDVFDLRFMESDLFTSSIYNRLKTELGKYNDSFDTIETDLYSELVDAVSRYYEIAELDRDTNREMLRDFILAEIEQIAPSIQSSLNLTVGTLKDSWNDYIVGSLIPEKLYTEPTPTNRVTSGPYVFVRNLEDSVYSYELRYEDDVVIAKSCKNENIEEGYNAPEPPQIENYTTSYGPYEFGDKVKTGFFKNKQTATVQKQLLEDFNNQNLVLTILDWAEERYKEENDKPNKDKLGSQYIIEYPHGGGTVAIALDMSYPNRNQASRDKYDLEITMTIDEISAGYYTIIQAEQSSLNDYIAAREEAIWNNLKEQLLGTKEFEYIFNDFIPLKTMISSIALYEYSALSDSAIFGSRVNGVNLFDMLTNTKLSTLTLQIFAAAIYGGGKISYQDPFLEKAGTDQVF